MISHLGKFRFIIICGSGGVGKTTTAAALGLALAEQGKKTLVVTIDPAKRLAQALGLEKLGSKPSRVRGKAPDTFWAMMLDAKVTFDALISKYAPNVEVRDSILKNRIYQHLSEDLAGTQEYMAMEALYEIAEQGDFDHIVLDTPPTHHALDFLRGPKKIMHFLEEGVAEWFFKPYFAFGRAGFLWMARGGTKIFSMIEKLVGFEILQELSEFFLHFKDMYGHFRDHSEWVHNKLHGPETLYLAVTSPERQSMRELHFFDAKLKEERVRLGGVIVNRVFLPHPLDSHAEAFKEGEIEEALRKPFHAMLSTWQEFQVVVRYHEKCLEILHETVGRSVPLLPLPYMSEEISDLAGLKKIGGFFH